MNEDKQAERTKNVGNARAFGAVVYVGGVIAATTLFITFVLSAFPADAYFTRIVMTVAGLAVGASMIAFPIALHNWIITKSHRKWGVPLYYIEMLIIGVNTVVSFITLLSKVTNTAPPEWALLYEPFSVGSIIYTIAAWGTVFLTDPAHKLQADEQDAEARFAQKIAKKREEFIDSAEGEDLVIEIASQDIRERWNADRFAGGKKSFGTGKPAPIPAPAPFVKKEATTEGPATGGADFRKE